MGRIDHKVWRFRPLRCPAGDVLWTASCVLMCGLALLCRERQASAGDLESSVDEVITSWRHKQTSHQTARYVMKGSVTIAKNYFEIPNTTESFPITDFRSDTTIELAIDFAKGRVRRTETGQVFNFSTREFQFDIKSEMYDGSEYQQRRPIKELLALCGNTLSGVGDLSPELYLYGPRKAPPIFQRPEVPLLLSHGIVPATAAVLPNTRPKLDQANFSSAGATSVSGRRAVLIDIATPSRGSAETIQCAVIPELGFAIARYSDFYKGVEAFRVETDFSSATGSFGPSRWRETTFSGKDGKQIARFDEFSLASAEYDVPLDDGLFRVRPAPGVVVYDVAGKSTYLEPEVGGIRRTVEEVYRERQGRPGRAIGLALTGLLLVAASIAFALRGFRRRLPED